MAAAVAAAMPLVLAGERSLFHLPSEHEVRLQEVVRADNETGWPFSVARGYLSCVWSAGQRVVFFFATDEAEDDETDAELRGVMLTMDPLQLTLFNVANHDLFAPSDDVAERIRQVAPLHAVGLRLCDQPPGAQVGEGEL